MMSLTQLEYIVAVEKHRNFRLAAKSCHVTQPTLSMQIQKLEDHLGVLIFDRSAQPVRTTLIGQKILDQSRVILSQAALLTDLISEEKKSISGELRVAVIPTLAPYLLPLFADELARRYPQLRLIVEESKTEDIIASLKKNQIDLGLLVTPLEDDALLEYPLFNEPFHVYAAKDSELAKKSMVSDEDLKNERLLLLAEGHCMREQMVRICFNHKQHPSQAETTLQFDSGSIETLCHLVEKGIGFTVIPHLAKTWRENARGTVVPFSEPVPVREVSIVTHRSFARSSLLHALQTTIIETLPSELKNSPNIAIDKVHFK
jgi:LysR family hydrogen peroxide-inducible transcriptional activator